MPTDKLRGSPEGLTAKIPDMKRVNTYGLRVNKTPKGPGYFGELARTDEPEAYSTELAATITVDGVPRLIPVLVPTLSAEEIAHLVDGGQPTIDILRKAKAFAFQRLNAGKSPFADFGEQVPLPQSAQSQFNEGFRSK